MRLLTHLRNPIPAGRQVDTAAPHTVAPRATQRKKKQKVQP
ncbi:hypothetical protein OS189_17345 [Sulfitobacter sp. F26169L]|nr:hypothetical protein [Sulfitobacter sp. F26169L]